MSKIEKPKQALEQILRRTDTWQGDSRYFIQQSTVTSGYCELDNVLQHHGWPLACLIEVCQNYHASEWYLFHHALNILIDKQKHIALINPPALPFLQGFAQLKIPYSKVLIVQPQNAQELVACFSELAKSSSCSAILTWQHPFTLSYSQLRKLQLNTTKEDNLYVLFRHTQNRYHSSPAGLRLLSEPQSDTLNVHIFKQRGKTQSCDIQLPVPISWQKLLPHKYLQSGVDNNKNIQYSVSSKHQPTLSPRILSMNKGVER